MNTIEKYDIILNTWTRLTPTIKDPGYSAAFQIAPGTDEKAYIVGLQVLQVFDMKTESFDPYEVQLPGTVPMCTVHNDGPGWLDKLCFFGCSWIKQLAISWNDCSRV